jgi:hypothetical protein
MFIFALEKIECIDMRKLFFIVLIGIGSIFTSYAQKLSFSINYLYLDERDNVGVGIQSKIRLKNNFYLLPDAGYFFRDHYSANTENSQKEYLIQHYVVNLNFAYKFQLTSNLSLLPFAGVGYFQKYSQKHIQTGGTAGTWIGNSTYGGYPPMNYVDKDHYETITGNLGLSLDCNVSEHLFLQLGLKYMLDFYSLEGDYFDKKDEPVYFSSDYFPYLNLGIGYSF